MNSVEWSQEAIDSLITELEGLKEGLDDYANIVSDLKEFIRIEHLDFKFSDWYKKVLSERRKVTAYEDPQTR